MRTHGWMRTAAWFGMFLFLLAGVCLAFEQAAPAAAPVVAVAATNSVWSGILKGVLAGGIAAVMGYMSQQKNADGTHQAFDVAQFAVTVVIGAGFGAYAGWKNLALADVENLPIVASIVAGIEVVLKAVWRNAKISIQGAFTTVQAGNPTPPATLPPSKPS